MKRILGFVAALCGLALVLAPAGVLASGGSGGGGAAGGAQPLRGSVVLKAVAVTSHSGSSAGDGQVIPVGGYYIAPAVACTTNITSIDVPDGTQVQVTLDYLPTSNLPSVTIGTITVSGGKGSLSTLSNPTPVSASVGFSTMSVRLMDGTVVLSGSIKGL